MLGYISSTRKKSCRQCVKSKRRCDLGYPCCKRCFTKGLDCAYPNASVREAGVVIRQTTPDFAPLPPSEGIVAEFDTEALRQPSNIDPALFPQADEGESSLDSLREERHRGRCEPRVCTALMPQLWAPGYLTEAQVMFLVSRLCAFVPSIAYTGYTPFIHRELYRTHQPTAYQDSCALSALYLMKTTQNVSVLSRSIDDKIASLIAASHTWTLTEHLAAVQALVIYQIIRLFDPELGLQSIASAQNKLLELWTAHLWNRSFKEPASFPTCYDTWVFYESLRRTVLMSVFLRGGWSCVTQGGLCDKIPVLARLPLTRDDRLWKCEAEEFEARRPCEKEEDGGLVAYGDWSSSWKLSDDAQQLSEFQRLLLAACRGDDPRLVY